ncbi:hypothetical protein [Streptomyces sp. NBC_01306]|uniref:hypothetical protein n=1 Tax=Streptomyces sp. NBC_01306 TaxID=2903819 RepID=UPI0022513F3D|nr:hypothetical protein [Streptomyces sp. NBC_01306]MCX4726844.1 hypothetical protein [Streptomyces sp. NBC_01306]
MSDLEARSASRQWIDTGSGPGRMQPVIDPKAARADTAYREFLDHSQNCPGSCRIGVNCATATKLQHVWRDAKNEAIS